MILYSSRSAKSVACSRLKVIGVRAFFFLPAFVAAFTSADEFHSVTETRYPAASSHFASRPSCVVLPDPSMPSTTISFPGYSCGVVRLFSIRVVDLDPDGLSQHPLERRQVLVRRPDLQLRVAGRVQVEEHVLAAVADVKRGNDLR